MLYPNLTELIKITGNRYRLVNVVAKKARDIADDAIYSNEILNEKPVKIAMLELYAEGDM